jgi:hemolysin activation/secretion protein
VRTIVRCLGREKEVTVTLPDWGFPRPPAWRRPARHALGALLVGLATAFASSPARAQAETGAEGSEPASEAADAAPAAPAADPADSVFYTVGELRLEFAHPVAGLPDVSELTALEVPLLQEAGAYTAPRRGAAGAPLSLARPAGTPPASFSGSAIRAIDAAVAAELNRRGIVGVLVRPHPEDIGASSGRDLRPAGETALRLVILVGRLIEQRTVASGQRVDESARIDNPVHERIKRNSPVQPGELLDRAALEAYADRLNRHPGRRVDLALGRAGEPTGAVLDYLVAENRPWTAYFQTSNTGTDETSDWRQRFGFTHNQLLGRDDVLQLDYITGDFSDVHATFGSYEAPVPFPWLLETDALRARGDASWSSYDASEVGIENASFEGDQWELGGRLTANVFQYRELFVDLFTGARFAHYSSEFEPFPGFDQSGSADYFFPEVGAQLERRTDLTRLYLSVSGEFNVSAIAGTDEDDFRGEQMGRVGITEADPKLMRFEGGGSFFVVPLFFPEKEPATALPASALSNEVVLSVRGQYTQDRLIPAQQGVLGGLDSVRGYPQSLIAADSIYLARAEYRVHIPRLLEEREPYELPVLGSFRLAPDGPSGRPDWDLIARLFVDVGRGEVVDGDEFAEEEVRTLMGAGIGLELQLPGELVLRVDYGQALDTEANVDNGDHEIHMLFALVY